MIVALNGFTVNDPTSAVQVYLDEPIDGLGLPPIRTSSGNYSGRDGGYVAAQFFGMRLITLTGQFFSTNAAALEANCLALAAAVSQSTVMLTITTNGGNQYLVNCNLDSLDMPVMRAITKRPFKVSLIAADPIIYDNSVAGLQSATVHLSTGGGITWPITWPPTWTGSTQPTTITNTGRVSIYPKVTMVNQMTSPTIANLTTGVSFTMAGFSTTAGDQLVIDMKNRTVLLNGGDVFGYVTSTSPWWYLAPGANIIKLTSANSADTVVATVQWKPGVMGI